MTTIAFLASADQLLTAVFRMIELRHISISMPRAGAGAAKILDDVTLTIQRGEWVMLAGPNGSGKTTLLKTIAGLITPAAGEIRTEIDAPPGRGISLLLQEPDNQFVASSVRWELVLSLPPELSEPDREERLAQAIDTFSLGDFLDRNPHRLSGGEKQRLAFATVWLSDPQLLLLDEPTSYLDRVQSERCTEFAHKLNRDGVTIVWATPDHDEHVPGKRVIYLDRGRLVDSIAANPREIDTVPDASRLDAPVEATSPPVVRMQAVSFAYGEKVVFDDFSLDLAPAECVAITGLNGVGKSTLLNLISGVTEPNAGRIERCYSRVIEDGHQNVFYLFQSPETLFFAETVYDEIAFGLRAIKTPKIEISKRVDHAITLVGLPPAEFRSRLPHSLSLGEMRRLAFAIAIAIDPRLLLMDEPASCLDESGRLLLNGLLRHFKARGRTVVVAAHDVTPFAPVIDRFIELGS